MNRKKVLKIFICVFLVWTLIIVFVIINSKIDFEKKCKFDFMNDSNAFAYQIEEIGIENDDFIIKGWFFELKSIRNVSRAIDKEREMGIILYDLNKKEETYSGDGNKHNKGVALNVDFITRTDINKYFKCEYDYSHSGFVARVNKSELNLENGQYQIIIKPIQDSLSGLRTNAYINNGKLQYINPTEECVLDTKGTDLESIVNNGFCLVSYSEKNIYIYQHENKLYWIADEGFCFEDDGNTVIEYQLDTTQFDKLPLYRTEKGLFWENKGAIFELCEVTSEMNCGRYRVCVREIPKEYSVYWIGTGYYLDGNWIWHKEFRPINLYK